MSSFFQVFLLNLCIQFSSHPYVLHCPPNPNSMASPNEYWRLETAWRSQNSINVFWFMTFLLPLRFLLHILILMLYPHLLHLVLTPLLRPPLALLLSLILPLRSLVFYSPSYFSFLLFIPTFSLPPSSLSLFCVNSFSSSPSFSASPSSLPLFLPPHPSRFSFPPHSYSVALIPTYLHHHPFYSPSSIFHLFPTLSFIPFSPVSSSQFYFTSLTFFFVSLAFSRCIALESNQRHVASLL
jgi:hypothetical protein